MPSTGRATEVPSSLMRAQRCARRSRAGELARLVGVLFRYARLDMVMSYARRLGLPALQVRASQVRNVVIPPRQAALGGADVASWGEQSYALFLDAGAEASVEGRKTAPAP